MREQYVFGLQSNGCKTTKIEVNCRPNKRNRMKTSLEVDEKDIITLLNKLTDIVETIRNGNGPALIHCPTYRWREHCGPNYDDELGYRKKEELTLWKAKDPIKVLEGSEKIRL